MEDYISLSYKYIYSDSKPDLNNLLTNIPSKPLLYCLSKINFELYFEPSDGNIQFQLLDYWLRGVDDKDKTYIKYRIAAYIELVREKALFFGKRYILEFFNYIFEHYNNLPERRLSPSEILQTFIAYLVIVEECNEKDNILMRDSQMKLSIEDLEKISWPFLMHQYECNHTPVHETETLKLFAALPFILNKEDFKKYLDEYLLLNGFSNIGQLVKSAVALITNQTDNYENNAFDNRYPILYTTKKADRLENLSLNHLHFKKNIDKNAYYKLMKERPLIKLHENEYTIIDFAFLKGKVFTGFLFDIYYETSFKNDANYLKFDQFKSIISKYVVEVNIFSKLLKRIFTNEGVVTYFESNETISIPDCYCRIGNIIFFMEFKDYLLRGEIFQSYSYTAIKKAIDAKFINGSSGVPQLKAQLNNFLNKEFKFDETLDYNDVLIIYPIIVHTSFALSCPGIQQYLNKKFVSCLSDLDMPLNIELKELVLMDLNVFVLHFNNLKKQNNLLSILIERHFQNYTKRIKEFTKIDKPNPIDYSTAFKSFDIEYFSLFKKEAIPHQNDFIEVIKDITGMTQNTMDYPTH